MNSPVVSRRDARYARMWLGAMSREPRLVRFLAPCIQSLRDGRNALRERRPWITFAAQEWMASILSAEMRIFEYGSGGSTLYFATRVKQVISIEHDPAWHARVQAALDSVGAASSVLPMLIEPRPAAGPVGDPSDPDRYASGHGRYREYAFDEYAKAVDSYGDGSFDLVFIDGRARPACTKHAVRKTRVGGYIVLDNSERRHYGRAMDLLSGYRRMDFFGPGPYEPAFWMTTAWSVG